MTRERRGKDEAQNVSIIEALALIMSVNEQQSK